MLLERALQRDPRATEQNAIIDSGVTGIRHPAKFTLSLNITADGEFLLLSRGADDGEMRFSVPAQFPRELSVFL